MAKICLFPAPSITIPNLPPKITLIFKRGLFWTYPTLKAIKIFIGRLSLSRVKGKTKRTLFLHSTADEKKASCAWSNLSIDP